MINGNELEEPYLVLRSNWEHEPEKVGPGEYYVVGDNRSMDFYDHEQGRAYRWQIVGIGAVIGLMAGFAMAGAKEMKDTSLKNLKDVRAYTNLPVLSSIPLLENDIVVQRRKQVMWVGWATATIAGLAIMAGSMAHYYLTK